MPEFTRNCPDAVHTKRHPQGKVDRRKHLSINPGKNAARCWSCGFATWDAESFCKRYGIDVPAYFGPVLDPHAGKPKTLRLPPEFTRDFSTTYGRVIWHYLTVERQLHPVTIAAYELGYCETGEYANRVIIPVYEGGVLTMYQGRDWLDTSRLKYKNPHKEDGVGRHAIFNLEAAAPGKVLVIVEGCFDALRLPHRAVAFLGKGEAQERRAKVLRTKPVAVVVALDDDADVEANSICAAFQGLVPRVLRYRPRHHDLGGAPPAELAELEVLCQNLAAPSAGAGAGRRAVG